MILLDAMLPDSDGFEICKLIANEFLMIMITERDSIIDKIVVMELGALEYNFSRQKQ
jgi:DNA-binding response OmpR family regulator